MNYINFDKIKLVNLKYALSKELIRSNRAGAYASTTIIGCNTRKYHGLLVVPQEQIDHENHVLLSSMDETIFFENQEFNLAVHKYPGGVYYPTGHKYIRDFVAEPIPKLTFRVGSVVITKEILLAQDDDRVLIRYKIIEGPSKINIRFKPLLAFRNIHALSKANVNVNTKYSTIPNGICVKMYEPYSSMHIQFSKKVEYIHVPDWYYKIEYHEEQKRGYDYQEDLFVPGFFEIRTKKGDDFIIAAGLDEIKPSAIKRVFENELSKRIPRDSFLHCLINSAQQFIARKNGKTEVIAGFPWFGRWGRDTFISLPGLTLSIDDIQTCYDVLDTMVKEQSGAFFPNIGSGETTAYNSVDAPLWFIWAVQMLAQKAGEEQAWKKYGENIKRVLSHYKAGTHFNIRMENETGLLYAGEENHALTWMDAIVDNQPVTPRIGFPVEINALWYNAIVFALNQSIRENDKDFVKEWNGVPTLLKENFIKRFWLKEKGYLVDYFNDHIKDASVRPNQIFAASLPYTMLEDFQIAGVLNIIEKELLTPKGLRTLSPKNPQYKGACKGSQRERDQAYHQGTVWPWLLGAYVEAYLRIYKRQGINKMEQIFESFEVEIENHGISTISEIYDGDPPHKARGTISQAWSVAELLRIRKLIDSYKNNKKP